MTRGYGRMRREDGRGPDPGHRVREGPAVPHQPAHALHHHERRVSLVRVPRPGLDPERGEHAHAADAEDRFLPQPVIRAARVELVGEAPVGGIVLLEIRVEEEQRDATDAQPPRPDMDAASPAADRSEPGDAIHALQPLQRGQVGVERVVRIFLPAVRPQRLVEVAVRVHQPDADEGDPEFRRRLEMVPREHAESPGVDGDGLVQREFRAEVRHRAVAERGIAFVEPGRGGVRPVVVGVPRRPGLRRVTDGHGVTPDVQRRVVSPEEDGIFGQAVQALVSDGSQQRHGVVPRAAPQRRIDGPEEGRGLRIPRPREVVREFPQPPDAAGDSVVWTHVPLCLLASAGVLFTAGVRVRRGAGGAGARTKLRYRDARDTPRRTPRRRLLPRPRRSPRRHPPVAASAARGQTQRSSRTLVANGDNAWTSPQS